MQVLWLKRDLRIDDHEALTQAAAQGLVLPLYILEPKLWQQEDMSRRHYLFLKQCLQELHLSLLKLGQGLVIKVGDAVEVLQDLHKRHGVRGVWSHQETGNLWTYERDRRVKGWTKEAGVPWHEPVQNGVVRGLKNREGWSQLWFQQMSQPRFSPPEFLDPIQESSQKLPSAEALGLKEEGERQLQKGGRQAALETLHSFLYHRGEGYSKELSSPVTAFESCSRLSPHLAFGTLSMREVFHQVEERKKEIDPLPHEVKGKWPSALRTFSSRLRWHCHFMQKLEDAPSVEEAPLHSAYVGVREEMWNEAYFQAWKEGKTGFPLVDASMRALRATGWLNFRMRAMVMSFASYHLWLHWKQPALYLARLFTDYEPGIHYNQVQMQSGTTGINTLRIYNPIKQGVEQDPQGKFIRQWVKELAEMGDECIHTPWLNPSQMQGYPFPIVEEKEARERAASLLYGMRKEGSHRQEAARILEKHGSRKKRAPAFSREKKERKVRSSPNQLELPLWPSCD